MSFLPSLPADAVLVNVFQRFPEVSSKLIEYHEVLMRGPSPLSVGERELIAGFVSSSQCLSVLQRCPRGDSRGVWSRGGTDHETD